MFCQMYSITYKRKREIRFDGKFLRQILHFKRLFQRENVLLHLNNPCYLTLHDVFFVYNNKNDQFYRDFKVKNRFTPRLLCAIFRFSGFHAYQRSLTPETIIVNCFSYFYFYFDIKNKEIRVDGFSQIHF